MTVLPPLRPQKRHNFPKAFRPLRSRQHRTCRDRVCPMRFERTGGKNSHLIISKRHGPRDGEALPLKLSHDSNFNGEEADAENRLHLIIYGTTVTSEL